MPFQFAFAQVSADAVRFYFQFKVAHRILFKPFVALTIQKKITEGFQQVDRSVVPAFVSGLDEDFESVHVFMVDKRKQ